MKMMHTKYTSTAIGLALALGGFQSAIAQEAAPEDKKSKAEMLIEEVVVYGTKRSAAQNAQAVPAQIAAFGTRQLEARQVVTIEDLTMATPNVASTINGAAIRGNRCRYIIFSLPVPRDSAAWICSRCLSDRTCARDRRAKPTQNAVNPRPK